ncbi:MAG: hypothetical protein ABIS51_16320 [Sphingomonas sp.]
MICFTLGDVADGATILTAATALAASAYYFVRQTCQRWRLEKYLLRAKSDARRDKEGRQSLIHLMAYCGLTEAEVLAAAFRSKKIKPDVSTDRSTGYADRILFEYQLG